MISLILFVPLIWEIWNDCRGDLDKEWDVVIRVFLMIQVGCLVWQFSHRDVFAAINLSFAIHFMLFDYLIVIILNRTVYERKINWFTHLSNSPIDKIWKGWNPWLRLLIRLTYFLASLILYFTL
jgi:hypothetical protein